MGELANYSIETDHTVLLLYKDGKSLRVPFSQLAHYLKPTDLERVRSAIKLRRDFIRRHMPKAVIALAVGGLLALFIGGSRVVATLWGQPDNPAAAPERADPKHDIAGGTNLSGSVNAPSPSTEPVAASTPAPAAKPNAQARAAQSRLKKSSRPQVKTSNIIITLPILPSPVVVPLPDPLAGPTPSPAPSTSPSPTPTPNPIAGSGGSQGHPLDTPPAQSGEVLGDSTQQDGGILQ